MDMKGMNPYQHFGLRQAWLEHFMNEGVASFSQNVLGNRQYDALKVWLKESQILAINSDRTLVITPLGNKLIEFGPYNPLTWAIIWAKLWVCTSSMQDTDNPKKRVF